MIYEVKVNDRIVKTLQLAGMENDSKWIPINMVENACIFNRKTPLKPISSQYLWFCLHGMTIRRKLLSGKIITLKVAFNPVYLENKKKFIKLVKKAMRKLSNSKRINFARLVDRSPQSLDSWRFRRVKIPLTAILKACQLLKLDLWEIINGEKLYSGRGKNCIIFRNRKSNEIREITTWIKAEGNLSVTDTRIKLIQKRDGIDSLEEIVNKIIKVFRVHPSHIHIEKRSDKPSVIPISIWSPPLRQILCLKYGIPLGFKSDKVRYFEIELAKNRKNGLKIFSKIFESEGCFSFRKWDLPDFFISSSSYDAVKDVEVGLKALGYSVYQTQCGDMYRVGIGQKDNAIKFCYEILPYFKHKGKIKAMLFGNDKFHGIASREYLFKLRIKSRSLGEILEKIKEVKKWNNRRLAEFFTEHGVKISRDGVDNWCLGRRGTPLKVVILVCDLLDIKYSKVIPDYMMLVLWTQGIISRKSLEKVRKARFKYVENVLKNEK